MRTLLFVVAWFVLASFGCAAWVCAADAVVDYTRDVKPILAKHCQACHGVKDQQSGLRLDAAQLLRRGGDRGPAITPGNSGQSLLIEAITGAGDAPKMPVEGDPLSKREIDVIRRWIDQGAKSPKDEAIAKARNDRADHWSFQPVRRPKPPGHANETWPRNAIDEFVLARLRAQGLKPSPEADRATLIRRLSFDLLGLPPTVDEVRKFEQDESADAYERLVERLLSSQHYGERWARHWLDAARYADSNGYTIDGPRSIWKYRDWVIDAFNRDLPFDRFTIEQIAGDMLPGATQDQMVATGFHRNTLINQEGGTDQEQFRVEAVVDRVSTTGAVYLGLTLGCARCHEHKFDPISQREFYQLFALFNNADEPTIPAPSPEQARRQAGLQAELSAAQAKLTAFDRQAEQRRQTYEQRLAKTPLEITWSVLDPETFTSAGKAKLTKLPDRSLLASGEIPASDTYTIKFERPLTDVTGLRVEALTHERLPHRGPGLAGNGNFVLSDIHIERRTLGEPDTPYTVKIVDAVADHAQDRFPVEDAFDADPDKSGWAINVREGSLNVDRSAVFVFDKPLKEEDARLEVRLRHAHPNRYSMGRFRISVTTAPPEALRLPADVREILALPPEKRTKQQEEALAVELRRTDPARAPLQAAVNAVNARLAALKKTIPTTMVVREREKPRNTFVHVRGDFLRHGAEVQPGVPGVLPPFPDDVKQPNRLDFARWLVDPDNPLTPRVTVNRMWQRFFGRGIVETEDDFGTQGASPTHPLLLDWLASEFVRRKWSFKAMVRLIVTSAAYRQDSRTSDAQRRADPFNKWLGRQSRLRLEAETIRDAALAASGLLSRKLKGPSVFPPQPKGIYVFTQNKKNWQADTGEDRFRRGMYTYFWRSSPDPFLTTFDAPNANVTCTRRVRSNTPLQALTLANDAAFLEIAKGLAARVLRESPSPNTEERLAQACMLCLARRPSAWENERLAKFYEAQLAEFSQHPADAKMAAPANRPEPVGEAEGAAWTAVARVLLNLDEFITRE